MGSAHGILISVFTKAAVELAYVFFVSTMFSIGLAVTADEFLAALQDYKLILRVLLGNLVIVPALGLILVAIFRLPTDVETAILLLALAPGGIQAIQFTGKVRVYLAFAASVTFLLSIVAIGITPLLAEIILPAETKLTLPYLQVIGALVLFLLAPLLAGFACRRKTPGLAQKLYKPVLLISNISFVTTIILTLALRNRATRALGVKAAAVMLILILSSMAVGWWLGGPEKDARRVSAIATSMRNAGVGLLIAVTSFPGRTVNLAVLAFMALMVPPNMIFTLYHSIRSKSREA